MFVSLNYKNKVHKDVEDMCKYTCAIVSNTNIENNGGEFHLISHGVKFNLVDGDFFFFQGKLMHGTSYRTPPLQLVLVAALVVSHSVGNIIRKTHDLVESSIDITF